ncbi:hypothetical protein [Euhalothece natronophila]|nr:hypothetical protein [Euhalothece natronophila]
MREEVARCSEATCLRQSLFWDEGGSAIGGWGWGRKRDRVFLG